MAGERTEDEQGIIQYALSTINAIDKYYTDSKFQAALNCVNNCNGMRTDLKNIYVRKLLIHFLKNSQGNGEEDIDAQCKMCRIMANTATSVSAPSFMERMSLNYGTYPSFYREYAEVLMENGEQGRIPQLLEKCMANCKIDAERLKDVFGPRFQQYFPEPKMDVEDTMCLFSKKDLSKVVEEEDTISLMRSQEGLSVKNMKEALPLSNKENIAPVINKVDKEESILDVEESFIDGKDKSMAQTANSFFCGTPRVDRRAAFPPASGITIVDLSQKVESDLQGVFSLVGYQLARLMAKQSPDFYLDPSRVIIKNNIDPNAELQDQFENSVFRICIDEKRRLGRDVKLSPAMSFLDCIHYLMFQKPLETRVINRKRTLAKLIKKDWHDADVLTDIFDEILNERFDNNWTALAEKLFNEMEMKMYIEEYKDDFEASIKEFNRIITQLDCY